MTPQQKLTFNNLLQHYVQASIRASEAFSNAKSVEVLVTTQQRQAALRKRLVAFVEGLE